MSIYVASIKQYNYAKGCVNRLARVKNGSSLMFSVRRVCVGARTVLRLPEKRTRYVLRLFFFSFFFLKTADRMQRAELTRTKKKARPCTDFSQRATVTNK